MYYQSSIIVGLWRFEYLNQIISANLHKQSNNCDPSIYYQLNTVNSSSFKHRLDFLKMIMAQKIYLLSRWELKGYDSIISSSFWLSLWFLFIFWMKIGLSSIDCLRSRWKISLAINFCHSISHHYHDDNKIKKKNRKITWICP